MEVSFDASTAQDQINKMVQPILLNFDRLIQRFVFFNFIFLGIGILQILFIFFFLLSLFNPL